MTDKNPTLPEMFDLGGRVALVTGGAMGIGREITEGFLELGATVVLTSRREERAKAAAEELAAGTGGKTSAMQLDVCDEGNVIKVFTRLGEAFGRLDILVNNAGGAPVGGGNYHLWERPLADWQHVIDTNLTGTFLCTREAVKLMMPKRSGSIINIASIAGLVGRDRRMYEGIDMRPNLVDYAASKAGILGFTRDAAAEVGPYGIRVNAISPGGVFRGQPAEFVRRYSDATPLGRMARDGLDMKAAAALLACDAGAYITGENIVVDGGFSIFR